MNRMTKAYCLLLVVIVMVPFYTIAAEAYTVPAPKIVYVTLYSGIVYHANVEAVWRHANGEVYFVTAIHNLLVDLGKDLIKTDIGVGGSVAGAYGIQPTNATFTPGAGSTYCCGGTDKTFVTTTALHPSYTSGDYASTGIGTWTVTHTFTLTVAVTATVYGAGLTTSSSHGVSADNLFAEAVFASTAPLSQVGDNVLIQWSLSVS